MIATVIAALTTVTNVLVKGTERCGNKKMSRDHLRGAYDKFPDFSNAHIKFRRLLKIHYVIATHLMRWLTFFLMISASNEQLQQQLEYTQLKPDCHSWWISKMQSVTLDEKMPEKRMECFRLLFNHLVWIEHQFLSGIRDSRKAGSLWRMMRGEAGESKSIHQSWLAKGLGIGLLWWGFKGVQEKIPSEEASTLQIRWVAFPPGQCTSPQLHPCHRLFDQDGHQDSSSTSL